MSTAVETRAARAATMAKPSGTHPSYAEMVRHAISDLRDCSGSSKAAIQRYIVKHYALGNDNSSISSNVRLALKRGVERGQLVQVSGSGMDGSYKLCEKKEYKVSFLKDKNNANSEKRKPASPENRGPRSTKKSNVETPAPVKPRAKKAEAARTPNTAKSAKPTSARPKSVRKATASKKK
ncbi:hypothetical protein KIN20_002182 [Parelaphostrongylus tenuis]|uniref:H15 domain-containing protein n=1 Tax=Parelaphostrongylus tenuis TaxID=148309 RepID=A0AAD5MDU6_PARTN|nr:hypothetical protein KIN20_002182 [Parelaphostrongylus tenuis]